ncbi:hypothetical protein JTE90_019167 [Oedothorax gibbosus]|uniref:CLIP domain-containing serine protease n=1 Tax=Oedothorax gibbosus TaxID=931172 RepID=A0AAV6UTW4_9ARAC|nr:hypothetical protein JTE90_019167 [Oedothorax gibbosus]
MRRADVSFHSGLSTRIQEPVMRLTKVLQVLLFLACAAISFGRRRRQIVFEDDDRNPSSDCSTPSRLPGQCIRWSRCPALRGINNWSRLQPHVCGFSGSEPSVCCPIDDNVDLRIDSTTTRRPRTTRRRTTTRVTSPVTRGISTTTPSTRAIVTTRRPTTTSTRQRTTNVTKPRFLPESCGENLMSDMRVVGLKDAEKGRWPWMAVVFIEKRGGNWSPDCGGALVTNRHVITAAHCVVSGRGSTTMNPRQLRVRLGAHDLRLDNEPGAIDVGVDVIRRHEQFDPRTYKNDIAVLRLSRSVQFTDIIKPVCLPYDSLTTADDLMTRMVWITGFGTSFNGAASNVLMEVIFDVTDQEECRRAYERELNITDVYLCAGTADGSKDSCQGDSGGPLVSFDKESSRYYLVGVVSFGKLCAQPGYPGVYTRVTKYLDWLQTNLAD